MKRRDLVNLSNGIYNLSDGIYNYTLEIKLDSIESQSMYIIKYGWADVYLFEDINKEDYEYEYPILTALTSVGGISIHSNNYWEILNELEFVPRGSFKEFVKRTNLK